MCLAPRRVRLLASVVVLQLLRLGSGSPATVDEAREQAELAVHRRLTEHFERHLVWHESDVEAIDSAGLLPPLEHAGLRLKEVYIAHKEEPLKVRRVQVPAGYEPDPVSRRLHALLDLVNATLKFELPRDRIRAMAVLSAATQVHMGNLTAGVLPALAKAVQVYNTGKQAYNGAVDDAMEASRSWAARLQELSAQLNEGNVSQISNMTKQEAILLTFLAQALRASAGKQWKSDEFLGKRSADCAGRQELEGVCVGDVGLSVSVYQDDPVRPYYRVIVFNGGTPEAEREYIMFLHRLWIIERFQDQLMLTWNLDAWQGTTKNMTERRASVEYERPVRCAYKDRHFQSVPEIARLAEAVQLPPQQLAEQGYWVLAKQVMRRILPRDRSQEEEPTTYFTGTGTGAMHAGLASMWLRAEDDKTYEAYLISGVGFECATRRIFKEVKTTDPVEYLHSYSHVMDVYANSIDRKIGEDCLFGRRNFESGLDGRQFCEKIIGHTGPELFYRGGRMTVKVGDVIGETPTTLMLEARQALEACSYFTHSAWYAALLLMDDNILFYDGKTDGGCQVKEPLPPDDRLEKCPQRTVADLECLLLLDNVQPLPVTAMLATAGSLAGCICFIGMSGYVCLRRVRDDRHLYDDDSENMPWPCCCLKRRIESDRQAKARQRVKDKRMKAVQREMKKQGIKTDDVYEVEMNSKKKNKKKGQGKKPKGDETRALQAGGDIERE